MLAQRPDLVSICLTLLLGTGIAALSRGAGFSTAVAAMVGALTATVGWWASASEP